MLTTKIFFHLMDKTGTWQKNLEAVHHCCFFLFFFQGVKQKYTELEKKGKSLLELRKVRKYEEGFSTKEFAQQALDIIIEAQELLTEWVMIHNCGWVRGYACVDGEKESKVQWSPGGRPACWKSTTAGRPLMRDHPGGRQLCWKTTLVVDQLSDRPPWWKTTLMRDHHDGRPLFWETTLVVDQLNDRQPDGRPLWWEMTMVEDYCDERPLKLVFVLLKQLLSLYDYESCPLLLLVVVFLFLEGLMRDHPGGRPPW